MLSATAAMLLMNPIMLIIWGAVCYWGGGAEPYSHAYPRSYLDTLISDADNVNNNSSSSATADLRKGHSSPYRPPAACLMTRPSALAIFIFGIVLAAAYVAAAVAVYAWLAQRRDELRAALQGTRAVSTLMQWHRAARALFGG